MKVLVVGSRSITDFDLSELSSYSKIKLKFKSSLFKGLRFPKAEPWSLSADSKISKKILSSRRTSKKEKSIF